MLKIKSTLKIISIATVLLTSVFTGCSLKYESEQESDIQTPEFIFNKASYTRYEKNNKTMQLNAEKMEQYKNDGSTFASNVDFSTWDSKDHSLQSKGSCELLGADTKKETYTLFRNIKIEDPKQNLLIQADSLKYNGKTEQITSSINDKVLITQKNMQIEGQGFSASGVSHKYSFTKAVSGSMDSDSKEGNSNAEAK